MIIFNSLPCRILQRRIVIFINKLFIAAQSVLVHEIEKETIQALFVFSLWAMKP